MQGIDSHIILRSILSAKIFTFLDLLQWQNVALINSSSFDKMHTVWTEKQSLLINNEGITDDDY